MPTVLVIMYVFRCVIVLEKIVSHPNTACVCVSMRMCVYELQACVFQTQRVDINHMIAVYNPTYTVLVNDAHIFICRLGSYYFVKVIFYQRG